MAPTGIAAAPDDPVRVFPNPASDKLQIRFPTLPAAASVTLYDIYGRIVGAQRDVSALETTLDIRSLPAGTYTYRVIADGEVYTGKILKQ